MQSTSRPPPPQGPPPSYAFVTRVYRKSLRPVVLATAFIAGIWALFSGIGWFRNFGVDRNQNAPHIANLSIALGALYLAVAVIGLVGVVAAAMQRTPLVRIYAYLTVLASLIVIGASLARVVTHFTWKDDLIKECTTLTTNQEIVYYGFWGPISHDRLDAGEAQDWCNRAWSHDSWSEIVALLILGVLAGFFTVIAFGYYRQILDPASAANASRAPSNQNRFGGAFPSHYNPPYNGGGNASTLPTLGYGYSGHPANGQYAPPAGPPPGMGNVERDDPFAPPYDGKPPGYTGSKDYEDDAKDVKDVKDPFSDGPSNHGHDERDVTSRPTPGGRDAFI